MQKLRILLFLLGLFQLCAISYANVIILNDSAESYNAIHNADYIQISKDKVFCEEELANVEWEKYPNKALLFSYKCRAVVLRIITNNRSKNSDFIITCQQPNTDHFEIINGHFETIKTSGDVHSWQKREFNDIFPSFSLNLRQGFQDTTYCKIIIAEDGIAPFQLRTRDSYYSHFAKRELVFGIFIGLMGVIVIYNLFLFFIINDKLYLHYALYVLAILFAQMSLYDGINHVYTDYVPLAKIDGIFFVAVLGPFGYGFVLNYFKLDKKSNENYHSNFCANSYRSCIKK